MKTISAKIKIFFLFLGLLVVLIPLITFANSTSTPNCYTFETGIPFFAAKGECKSLSGLQNMISSLINKLFPIAGILAFAMIVYAGFEYATSGGDTNKQKDAQDRIANAIIGLLLLFAFWIIIYTINPDILKTKEPTLESVSLPSISNQSIDPLSGFTKICDGPLHLTPIPYSAAEVLNTSNCFYIKEEILNNLKALYNNTGKTWKLTEACQILISGDKPCGTTYQHNSLCHQTGDCVDIALDSPTEQNKTTFIQAANNGLDIYNEYKDECKTKETTGGHFHVVIHGFQQCTNSDCRSCAK